MSALEEINKSDFKNVVLGGAWFMYFFSKRDYFFEDKHGKYSINEPKGRELAVNSLIQTIKDLKSKGKNVFFIKDAPYILDVSPGIYKVRLQPFLSYDPHGHLDVTLEKEQLDFIAYLAKKAEDSGARVINIFDKVCKTGECRIVDDGEYVYADPGHFNPSWLRKNQFVLEDIRL